MPPTPQTRHALGSGGRVGQGRAARLRPLPPPWGRSERDAEMPRCRDAGTGAEPRPEPAGGGGAALVPQRREPESIPGSVWERCLVTAAPFPRLLLAASAPSCLSFPPPGSGRGGRAPLRAHLGRCAHLEGDGVCPGMDTWGAHLGGNRTSGGGDPGPEANTWRGFTPSGAHSASFIARASLEHPGPGPRRPPGPCP